MSIRYPLFKIHNSRLTCFRRTLFIWIISLGLGWETFKYLQVVGFVVLIYGTFLFNNVVTSPEWTWLKDNKEAAAPHSEPLFVGAGEDEERPLLAGDASVPSER